MPRLSGLDAITSIREIDDTLSGDIVPAIAWTASDIGIGEGIHFRTAFLSRLGKPSERSRQPSSDTAAA